MSSIYSVFYDDKGKEIFVPKGIPVKEKQAGEILGRLFESTASKRQVTQEMRPVKKRNPRQYAEQTSKVGKNKEIYKKKIIDNLLKEIEKYQKSGEGNKELNKLRDTAILYRNNSILFRA